MATMFPQHVDFPDGRYGERTVWEALRDQLPDDVVVWYSVRVLDGESEREIDLLVGWPGVGFAAIEVKGGRVGRTSRAGTPPGAGGSHRIEDPVAQVQDARHHLTNRLGEHGVAAQRAVRARWVHMVAFPAMTVPAVVGDARLPARHRRRPGRPRPRRRARQGRDQRPRHGLRPAGR